ncbi:MAG: caspase family protein [Cyanobacteria bacterium TGS_CYA1]|nr:caspase family protein [Cyanobacteria bacterium TGS_CYA1]
MKKIILLLICALLLHPVAFAQSTAVGDKWALVIGISKFQDPSLDLKYPAKDAKDFCDFLIEKANFAPDHVKLLVDNQATRSRILTEIGDSWLPRLAKPNDLVVIYFSSHGSPSQMDLEGMNYVVAHDTSRNALFGTGISLQDLASTIQSRVHCDRIVLILDACHSGAAKTKSDGKGLVRQGNFDVGQIPMGKGMLIICSSEPNQVSWESKKYENGVFTKKLIDGFSSRGQYTRLNEAFKSLKDSVQSEVLQERGELQQPVMKSVWKGDDLVLASKPVSPASVPEELKGNGGKVEIALVPTANSNLAPTPVATVITPANRGSLVDRISILPVVGPSKVKMDAIWQGFAQKDNLDVTKRLLELELDKKIETEFQKELKHCLRNKDVVTGDVSSKYQLQMEVLEVELQDNYMGDIADVRLSGKLVNAETGETIWMLKSKKFSRLTQAKHDDSVFSEITNYFPRAMAKELAKTITGAIKDQ